MQTLTLKALGLFRWPSRLRTPNGALLQARNCNIDREGVLSSRRGLGRLSALNNPPTALSEYQRQLVALDGASLRINPISPDSWSTFPGSFVAPDPDPMRFLESNGNLYFTTTTGVQIVDSPTGTPVRSGLPQGLDCTLTLADLGDGFFAPDAIIGYRHTWKRTDANLNAKQGEPSFQERIANPLTDVTWSRSGTTLTVAYEDHPFTNGDVILITVSSDESALPLGSYTVSNSSTDAFDLTVPNAGDTTGTATLGATYNVSLVITIPADIQVGDLLEVWRTLPSADEDTAPGDEHRLILSHAVTTGDLATGTISLTDDQDDAFLGANLYTNASLEGAQQGNSRPPYATIIVQFSGHTFYFGARQPHQLPLQLLSVSGLTPTTSTITLTLDGVDTIYTAETTEDTGALEFQVFTDDLDSLNIERTAKSLQRIINRDTDGPAYAHYVSGEDDAPGKLLLIARTLADAPFSLTSNNASTTGAAFKPILPTSGTAVLSENLSKPAAAWRSKFSQPEAVPVLNTNTFGRADLPVLNAVASKSALLVYKQDGLFVLSGQSDGSAGAQFSVGDDFDPTVILTAPKSLVVLDNSAFGYTSQGVLKVAAGAAPACVSRPQIEDDLFRLASFSNFDITHAIAYESAHKYLLWTASIPGDPHPTQAWVYNTSNNAWTTWDKPVTCGHVLSLNDRLYLGHATEPVVLQERKDFSASGSDFADEDFPVTITAGGVNAATFTYTGYLPLMVGCRLAQGTNGGVITEISDLGSDTFAVTVRDPFEIGIPFETGAATVFFPIPIEAEWAPATADNPTTIKQFSYCQLYLDDSAGTHQLAFKSDARGTIDTIDEIFIPPTAGWGSGPWGEFPWGEDSRPADVPLRTWIPRNSQLCRSLSVFYSKAAAYEPLDILALALDVRPISTKSERQPPAEAASNT